MTAAYASPRVALIAGASGIVGGTLARYLTARGWEVLGLARNPVSIAGVEPVVADLTNEAATRTALAGLAPTHVFASTWSRRATEAENCAVNGGMIRNLMKGVAHAPVEHAALVTGLKHYLGPFESYGRGALPQTPFREEQPRQAVANFYYDQEDEIFAAAAERGFSWSVHRPHTIIGFAIGNAMNMGVTLAAYASICRESGRPFVFPGSRRQWESLTDMTDAGLLAEHLEWASTSDAGRDQAFNVVNGDVFRWSWMWERIAGWFGLEAAPYPGEPMPLEVQMANDAPLWREIAERYDLAEPKLERLASAWHTDADLGRPIEVVTDMTKSRRLGFLAYRATDDSFFDLFESLRRQRYIP